MAEEKINALGAKAAYNLADVTKTNRSMVRSLPSG